MLQQNTQNTSKTRKSFAIDCTNRFDKNYEVYFYRLPRATEKEKQMDPCNSQKQMGSGHRNTDLQLSFDVNMLNFGVKSYPIYCIDNSSIKYLLSYILHNWMFLNKDFGLDDTYIYI